MESAGYITCYIIQWVTPSGMLEQPSKGAAERPPQRKPSERRECHLSAWSSLYWRLQYGAVSHLLKNPTYNIYPGYKIWNQECLHWPKLPVIHCGIRLFTTLVSIELEVLIPKRNKLLPRDKASVSVNYKLRHIVPKGKYEKTEIAILSGIMYSNKQWVRTLLHNRNKEKHLWNPGDPHGSTLVLSCSIVIVNGPVLQPQQRTVCLSKVLSLQVWKFGWQTVHKGQQRWLKMWGNQNE